ncbi:MAG: hypothetical protein JWL60_2191 [Gemmatimonadetes bacterium]|jgi:hypothetical protein|nr:hypothetical protein [Gemmatimonadota bacterium]
MRVPAFRVRHLLLAASIALVAPTPAAAQGDDDRRTTTEDRDEGFPWDLLGLLGLLGLLPRKAEERTVHRDVPPAPGAGSASSRI